MENSINTICVDQNEFTIEDAKQAAKQLFDVQVDDFYSLKTEKWYGHLLNAITFGADRKKKMIKDIRSLSKLQSIFMHVYYENYKDLDSQLTELINNLARTNQVVKKLYLSCVIGIRPQEGLEKMSAIDQNILLLTLSNYKSVNGKDNEFQRYRASVAKTVGVGMPDGAMSPEQLEKANTVDVFYRCLAELRTIDETDAMPENIELALEHLNLSIKARSNIDSLVKDEAECFGIEYVIDKYSNAEEGFWSDVEWETVGEKGEYKDPEEKEWLDITNECAQVYFKDCYAYDVNKRNVESASFVVYCEDSTVYSLSKVSGKKEVLLENIKDASDMFAKKRICAKHDAIYYVMNNDLRVVDIATKSDKMILHIPEEKDDEGNLLEIKNISLIYNNIIYRCGYKFHIVSLVDGSRIADTSFGSETNGYSVYNGEIYFLDSDSDLDDMKKGLVTGYRIRKYSIESGEKVNVSVPFAKRDILKEFNGIKAAYDVVLEGMYQKYYYVIFEYNSINNMNSRYGFDCFYFDVTKTGTAEEHKFYIWESCVNQIEQCGKYLTYVNGSKGYKLIKNEFLNDKKTTLAKNCGSTEKASFTDKLFLGKDNFKHPSKYMRLGNWIWIREEGKITPLLIKV